MTVHRIESKFVFSVFITGIIMLPMYHTYEKVPDVTKADFNKTYSSSINTTNEAIYEFTYSEMKIRVSLIKDRLSLFEKGMEKL
jgi:hypothetical protein